jgi:hypothetical protein
MIRRVLESITEQEDQIASTEQINTALRKHGWIPDPEDERSHASFPKDRYTIYHLEWIGPYENLTVVVTEKRRSQHEGWRFNGARVGLDFEVRPGEQRSLLSDPYTDWHDQPLVDEPAGAYEYSYTVRGLLNTIRRFVKKYNLKYRRKRT